MLVDRHGTPRLWARWKTTQLEIAVITWLVFKVTRQEDCSHDASWWMIGNARGFGKILTFNVNIRQLQQGIILIATSACSSAKDPYQADHCAHRNENSIRRVTRLNCFELPDVNIRASPDLKIFVPLLNSACLCRSCKLKTCRFLSSMRQTKKTGEDEFLQIFSSRRGPRIHFN